jgi:hypothetical protein
MSADYQAHARALVDALIDADPDAVKTHQDWLMGECAAGLLDQDGATLAELRAAVADLAPVADRYGQGLPGDRWRAVWELLHAIGAASRPLEQRRLARPERVSGRLLRLIRETPGISPGRMATALGKQTNHVSNALRGLLDQGLVQRLPRGREVNYYLTETGREALADEAPAELVAEAPPDNARTLPFVADRRMQRTADPYIRPGAMAHGSTTKSPRRPRRRNRSEPSGSNAGAGSTSR